MPHVFSRIGNVFLTPLLRSPLHPIASSNLTLINVTGRKTGKRYTIPVEYRRLGNSLIVLTRKERRWWKNLRGGAPISLRLCGQDVQGMAEVASFDKGSLFETVTWMYPDMPVKQVADLLPELVALRIHLPQTQVVPA